MAPTHGTETDTNIYNDSSYQLYNASPYSNVREKEAKLKELLERLRRETLKSSWFIPTTTTTAKTIAFKRDLKVQVRNILPRKI